MAQLLQGALLLTPAQLRRLHALWHLWTRKLRLNKTADRALRHYYIELFTSGRVRETKQLTRADAELVVARLGRLVRAAEARQDMAAGTAGRQGFPERPRVRPTSAAWRALWGYARALGMDRVRLDGFIRARYASVGLRGVSDIRTMADLNRVLWGLKAILRRRPGGKGAARPVRKRAA